MRLSLLTALLAIVGLSLTARAQTTRPDESTTLPTTFPTSRPTPVQLPSAASFLPLLESDAWQERSRAEDDLIRMGEDARSIIKELLNHPHLETEVRTRLEAALAQIEENRLAGPSYITLHLKDADLKTVFAELSRQCYVDLKPMPENLFEQTDVAKVTLDIDRQPFWVAMTQITEKTGIDVQQYNEGVRLMRGTFRMTSAFSSVKGPFQIVASQISRSQTEMLANGGGSSSDFSVQMMAYSEPKLHVLSSNSSVKLDEVVDDHGNSLLMGGPDNRGYYGGGGGSYNLFAQLKYPDKNPGHKITRLRGSAVFVIQTKSQLIQIPNIKKLNAVTKVVADMPVILQDLKKNADTWDLRIIASPQALGPNRWNQFMQSIQSDLQLLDDAGQALDHRGMRSTGNGTKVEFTLLFSASTRPSDGRSSTDPAKIAWEVPTASKDIEVPFDFKDLPMPK